MKAVDPPESPAGRPSVAVLPFINLSTEPENDYFADGLTEDVIAQLSKVGGLKVIARASIMRFKTRGESLHEIAARLQVATVLDGCVQRIGDRVRIVAELVDTDSEQPLWAETYDRQLTDIFATQKRSGAADRGGGAGLLVTRTAGADRGRTDD